MPKLKKNLTIALNILLSIGIIWQQLGMAAYAAMSPEQQALFSSGINYFNVADSGMYCTEETLPAVSGATNTDYAGKQVIPDAQMKKIEENAPFYIAAADKYDLPWQILAVIHIRETTLGRSNPSNGQGIYQFLNKNGGPYPAGAVDDAEFQRQTDYLANMVKNDYVTRNYPNNRTLTKENASPETIKDLFFSYNGRSAKYSQQATVAGYDPATQGYEGSPYVMNKADSKRDPNVNKTTWGQVKRDKGPVEFPANQGYGAFVMYAALSGIQVTSSGSASCNSSINLENITGVREKIVALAQQELALWQSGALVPGTGYKKYSQNRSENWCADFTSWIYNQAGVPLSNTKDGNVAAVQSQMEIGKKTGRFHPKEGYTPKPGDIVIRKNGVSHVNIVISVTGTWPDGKSTTIGGNQGGGRGGFNASKVTQYSESLSKGEITGYVSPE